MSGLPLTENMIRETNLEGVAQMGNDKNTAGATKKLKVLNGRLPQLLPSKLNPKGTRTA